MREWHAVCTCGWHKVWTRFSDRSVPAHRGSHYRKGEYAFSAGGYDSAECPVCHPKAGHGGARRAGAGVES